MTQKKDKNFVLPQKVLYISDFTANSVGLTPRDWVTSPYQGRYCFLETKEQITDVNYIKEEFKRTKRGTEENAIDRPILALGVDRSTPTMLIADNAMEAEEAADILGQNLENQEERLRKEKRNAGNRTPVVDTEWVRYASNGVPSSEFDRFVKQAIRDRMEKHRKNPITDPPFNAWDDARKKGLADDPTYVTVPEMSEPIKETTNE